MPRIPYEQLLAQKAAARDRLYGRRGSYVGSETDASSLFSSTTYQTQSQSHSYTSSSRDRHAFPGRTSSANASYQYEYEGLDGQLNNGTGTGTGGPSTQNYNYLAPPTDVRKAERARRRKERAERASRSREAGEWKYGSPLRSFVRFMEKKGWTRWTLPFGVVAVMVMKAVTALVLGRNTGAARQSYGDLAWSLAQEIIWCYMVYFWVDREGRREGRSWRTRMSGTLTILFSPVFILTSSSPGSLNLPLSAIIMMLFLLNAAYDKLAMSVIAACILFVPNGFETMNGTLNALLGYVGGKGVWLGGGLRGGRYYFSIIAIIIGTVILTGSCGTSAERVSDMLRPWLGQSASERISDLFGYTAQRLSYLKRPLDHICALQEMRVKSRRTMPEGISSTVSTWLHILIMIFPVGVLVHISQSLRPRKSPSPSSPSSQSPPSAPAPAPAKKLLAAPTIHLLPMTIFIASLPTFFSSPTPQSATAMTLPISLLMAFHGPAGRSGGGDSRQEDVWTCGGVAHIIAVMSLVPLAAGTTQLITATAILALWIFLVGYPTKALLPLTLRLVIALCLPHESLVKRAAPIELISVRCFALSAWVWGMKKLVEAAWAMGGLGSGSSKAVPPILDEKGDKLQ